MKWIAVGLLFWCAPAAASEFTEGFSQGLKSSDDIITSARAADEPCLAASWANLANGDLKKAILLGEAGHVIEVAELPHPMKATKEDILWMKTQQLQYESLYNDAKLKCKVD
jgi:hypothetical protein